MSSGKRPKSKTDAAFVRNPEEEYTDICTMNPAVGRSVNTFIRGDKKLPPTTATTPSGTSNEVEVVAARTSTTELSNSLYTYNPMHMMFTWVDSTLVEHVGVQIALASGISKDLKNNIRLTVSTDGMQIIFECAWPTAMSDTSLMLAASNKYTRGSTRTAGILAVTYDRQIADLKLMMSTNVGTGVKAKHLGSIAKIPLPFEVERRLAGVFPTRCRETGAELIYVYLKRLQEVKKSEDESLSINSVGQYEKRSFDEQSGNKCGLLKKIKR